MNYPARMPLEPPPLDLARIGKLTFYHPDDDRFPCLGLGYEALRVGGTMAAAMNAANEIAVAAYLDETVGFLDIPVIIRKTMEAHRPVDVKTVEDALEADRWARDTARGLVKQSLR
jgi:1-deoxy-D-xylulose-5-phosphate reductoisomerase